MRPSQRLEHGLGDILLVHLDRVIAHEPIARRVPLVSCQPLQQFLDVWKGPTLTLGAVVESIVGHTLAKLPILLLGQHDWCTPRPIILDNLPRLQLLLEVLPDCLELQGCKMTSPQTIEWF